MPILFFYAEIFLARHTYTNEWAHNTKPTMILQILKKHHFFFAHVEVEGINVNHNDGNKIVNCKLLCH